MIKKRKKIYPKDLGVYENEVSVDISFTAFFTAVALFFMGVLIRDFSIQKYGNLIEIPILFLMISACGFLYSTLIYANATGKFILFKSRICDKKNLMKKRFERCILIATTISEYFGVYFLILSIPLAVTAINRNIVLSVAILIAVMGGLLFYHVSGFCVMSRHFKHSHYLFILLVMFFELILFSAQFLKNEPLAYISTTLLVLFIFSLTIYIGRNSDKLIENLEDRK